MIWRGEVVATSRCVNAISMMHAAGCADLLRRPVRIRADRGASFLVVDILAEPGREDIFEAIGEIV